MVRIINESEIESFLDLFGTFKELTDKKFNLTKEEVINLFKIWIQLEGKDGRNN